MADEKRRSKRQSMPVMEEGMWECSMCTYKNPPEFFKCEICECRKGTSTRKPRLNPQLIAQQAAQSVFTPPPAKKDRKERRSDRRDRDKDSLDAADASYEDESIPDSSPVGPESREQSPAPVLSSSPPSAPPPPAPPTAAPIAPAPPTLKKEPSTSKAKPDREPHTSKCHKKKPARLKNIDRSSGQSMDVTVGNVTVTITDYKPLRKEKSHGAGGTSGGGKNAASATAAHDSSSNKDSAATGGSQHTPEKQSPSSVNGDVKSNS